MERGKGEQCCQCKWIDTLTGALSTRIHDTVDGQSVICCYLKMWNKLSAMEGHCTPCQFILKLRLNLALKSTTCHILRYWGNSSEWTSNPNCIPQEKLCAVVGTCDKYQLWEEKGLLIPSDADYITVLPSECKGYTGAYPVNYVNFNCQKSSRIIQNLQHSFNTWDWPPSPLPRCVKNIRFGLGWLPFDINTCQWDNQKDKICQMTCDFSSSTSGLPWFSEWAVRSFRLLLTVGDRGSCLPAGQIKNSV